MKAAVMRGPQDIRTESVVDPKVDTDGVIIRVKACGVCGSDLHVYKETGHEGTTFGHEFSGDVVEVGHRVSDIRVGDRVTAVGFRPCGQCFWCQQGKPHRCSDMALLGYQMPGAMAEFVSIPLAALGRNVFKLPDALTYEDGATVEPLSISLFSVKEGPTGRKRYGSGPGSRGYRAGRRPGVEGHGDFQGPGNRPQVLAPPGGQDMRRGPGRGCGKRRRLGGRYGNDIRTSVPTS